MKGKVSKVLFFFLKQKTRERIRRSGTGLMFLSEQSLGAGNKGVGFVKAEYLGLGWVGDRERGFTRGISSERKISEIWFCF